MIRSCAVLLLAGMSAGAANQTDLPAQLTLAQALQIALSNSTTIREAMAGLEQATGQYQQARSYLLPQLNLGALQSYDDHAVICALREGAMTPQVGRHLGFLGHRSKSPEGSAAIRKF
jgi:outer membrane protein TolC